MSELKKLPLFNEIKDDELLSLEMISVMKDFDRDEAVLEAMSTGEVLCIVIEGRIVSTLKLPGSIERKQGELSAGDIFGGAAVFGNKPLFESYIAAERSRVLFINRKGLDELIENDPGTAIRFISVFLGKTIGQSRKSSRFLADVVQWGESASRRVITDEQTGIYNRAFLNDALENFFNISKSNSKPLSLLMLDLDNCRKINEVLGHDTGNKIISEFAVIIKDAVSRHGIAARYGGDEFCILLPETGLEKARVIAEQIRKNVEGHDFSPFIKGSDIRVTTSIGISSFPETVNDLQSFREKADASLYAAKEAGRNRVASVN